MPTHFESTSTRTEKFDPVKDVVAEQQDRVSKSLYTPREAFNSPSSANGYPLRPATFDSSRNAPPQEIRLDNSAPQSQSQPERFTAFQLTSPHGSTTDLPLHGMSNQNDQIKRGAIAEFVNSKANLETNGGIPRPAREQLQPADVSNLKGNMVKKAKGGWTGKLV